MFIKNHSEEFSVSLMCEVFDVSRSGFYEWQSRIPSPRTIANEHLDEKIKLVYSSHKQSYGSPRITRELKAQGIICSKARIERRMKILNIRGIAKKKFKMTTDSEHQKPVYENMLNRDFSTHRMDEKWVGDITYIPTEEGWLYLAMIIDLHSRSVIGWSMNHRMTQTLVCDALRMALFKRKFPKNVIMHTDRGSQYCSFAYRNILKAHSFIGSMSRKGNCWDNAVAESFFHTLKVELMRGIKYKSRELARQDIFEYIEGYYNRRRMHSSIDYKTPYEVECAAGF